MALLLGRTHCPARRLERIGIVVHDRELVLAAQGDACGHVEIPPHVAAGVLMTVLAFVHLQDDGAPGGVEHEVREGAGCLRLQPTAAEGQVVLKFELQALLTQQLVHLQLLALRQSLGVVAVAAAHVIQKATCVVKSVPQALAAFDVADAIVAFCAAMPNLLVPAYVLAAARSAVLLDGSVNAEGGTAAAASAPRPLSAVFAIVLPIAAPAVVAAVAMNAGTCPAAVAAVVAILRATVWA